MKSSIISCSVVFLGVIFTLGCPGTERDCREVVAHPYSEEKSCFVRSEREVVGCWPQGAGGDNNADLCWFDDDRSHVITEDYNILKPEIEAEGWTPCGTGDPAVCPDTID